ncbi:MAG: hypothetical protein Ct9H300mP16_02750 [Pseudomonadota bacterium]|nr:MAG: hypothetical protein Ct9H300mP16_02750 [Pseudomonadota bacterium]
MHLACHLLLIATASRVVSRVRRQWPLPAGGICAWCAGISLFAPLHETIHRTAFRSRYLNTGVAALGGFLLLLPPLVPGVSPAPPPIHPD